MKAMMILEINVNFDSVSNSPQNVWLFLVYRDSRPEKMGIDLSGE